MTELIVPPLGNSLLFADEIYKRRTALRKTQQQLAIAVGVSGAHISNIETEKAELTRDLAVKIELQLREWEGRIHPASHSAFQVGVRWSKLTDREAAEILIFMEEQQRTT
ncbi:helix-turn-helix transcriptional regulator [Microbispora sp. NPDC049633]|uniref:helix-turn-helix transcriptional regulator n=1 Tax=Microbispora sp. NPDC049633 TaxID=3154355 RepID=UPI00342E5B36